MFKIFFSSKLSCLRFFYTYNIICRFWYQHLVIFMRTYYFSHAFFIFISPLHIHVHFCCFFVGFGMIWISTSPDFTSISRTLLFRMVTNTWQMLAIFCTSNLEIIITRSHLCCMNVEILSRSHTDVQHWWDSFSVASCAISLCLTALQKNTFQGEVTEESEQG